MSAHDKQYGLRKVDRVKRYSVLHEPRLVMGGLTYGVLRGRLEMMAGTRRELGRVANAGELSLALTQEPALARSSLRPQVRLVSIQL